MLPKYLMKGAPSDFLSSTDEHKRMWPKIQSTDNEISAGQQPKQKHWSCSVLILFFGDGGITIRLYWGAGEFYAGEILCVHLLVISSFSSASHNYGNRLKEKLGLS